MRLSRCAYGDLQEPSAFGGKGAVRRPSTHEGVVVPYSVDEAPVEAGRFLSGPADRRRKRNGKSYLLTDSLSHIRVQVSGSLRMRDGGTGAATVPVRAIRQATWKGRH